jgi:hypothetical protein
MAMSIVPLPADTAICSVLVEAAADPEGVTLGIGELDGPTLGVVEPEGAELGRAEAEGARLGLANGLGDAVRTGSDGAG